MRRRQTRETHTTSSEESDGDKRKSRDILQKRWVQDKKITLHELAKKYGVSAERIRQIESKALKKLRHPARSAKLKEFV